jgi:uncharacterized protein DUF6894
MPRYYFDLRDGDDLAADEEGMVFATIDGAQSEAAHSLADMARDAVRRHRGGTVHGNRSPGRQRTGVRGEARLRD